MTMEILPSQDSNSVLHVLQQLKKKNLNMQKIILRPLQFKLCDLLLHDGDIQRHIQTMSSIYDETLCDNFPLTVLHLGCLTGF